MENKKLLLVVKLKNKNACKDIEGFEVREWFCRVKEKMDTERMFYYEIKIGKILLLQPIALPTSRFDQLKIKVSK